MNELVRKIEIDPNETEQLLAREWLVTNGLGSYASGTISGAVTRRYHGFLIAALPTPLGRIVMLNHLSEHVRLSDGTRVWLGAEEKASGKLDLPVASYLKEFRLEDGLPVWRFEIGDVTIEKRVLLPHLQNTVHVNYRLLCCADRVRLKLRPAVHFRHHEDPVNREMTEPYVLHAIENRLELSSSQNFPPLRMMFYGERSVFTIEGKKLQNIYYRIEAGRGYENVGDLWSPGYFGVDLAEGQQATLVASTEDWNSIRALSSDEAYEAEIERSRRLLLAAAPEARASVAAELVLAADQFVITPSGRVEDAARAHAAGEEVRSVIAGYHWFTDWGRDTMISLEGLTLTTGRRTEAEWILHTFAHYVRDGLIPNMFPEGENEGLYHTADATLWFFHAMDRYLEITNDRTALEIILPKLLDIAEHHLKGTRFGIGVDPRDGLLRQGAEGYQLTWMDAKCDGWVVTPRRGKAVEINALWYNALSLLGEWVSELKGEEAARPFKEQARQAYRSFNERFWYAEGGYLYDVVDGEDFREDAACRPNQLLAISLRHAVLDKSRWESVINVVREKLLTPVGLRSLSPDHPDFKPKYFGDLRARDAAYHQGTVWAWLIGPFIDAWLKVHPEDRAGARKFLEGFVPHLDEACIGSISEVFDAEPPYTARGCIAQAWSVAEVLRCWVKTAD
ncbi:MAG: glycogen debranching protein [Acidobacteria bacterium 13_1_20CM_3_53_8]|nr:MAG: glycogen debranching protein [Acidobacteria bacterium 13_1_20CM_3_53_8]